MAAEAAVSFAVETLGKLLIDKAQFLIGVKGEVEWVRDEHKSIQCFMNDAAKKQSDEEGFRNWISSIREVAHEAEDAIETFVLKVQSKSLKKKYGCFPSHLYHLNRVGQKIKSIRQKLKDIQVRRVSYKFENDGSGDQKAEPSNRTRSRAEEIEARRRVAHWKPDQQVVGLEGDVKLLLREAVLKESEGPLVAAIVGMGGMGKSTLASKIYNHPAVAGWFGIRSWVVVSSEFTAEDIMKQILLQLGISADELKRLGSVDDNVRRQEELKKEVHNRLTGKRYFIVLDDVWEDKHWQSLTTAFPQEDKGSRLLLTSRNHVITRHDGYVHDMKPLGDTESWDLFMRKAFGRNTSSIHGCPEELKKVGEEILKKCGGLPLAISVVGGLLAKKTTSKSEWERVHMEMESHLDRSSGDLDNILGILELSYHNLTPELKACFLCLGFFREDVIIKAKRLVHIWVAQGLVAQREDLVEDVARDYINELVTRNMVQVKEMEYDQVRSCQMHDLVRDLSIRKAREEMDFEVVREGRNSHPLSNKPRHRAIYCSDTTFIYSTDRNQYLRSLFVYPGWSIISGGPSSYWKSFELLRVLDFERTTFKVFPKAIGELTGLRYIKMNHEGWGSRLPRSWAKLKNLEVLDLRGRPVTIDEVITKMLSLRHLYANVSFCKVGLGNMRNLRTLDMFTMMRSSDVRKIQGMSGVSRLGIRLLSAGETNSLFTCLSSLDNLSRLNLYIVHSFSDLEGLTSLHRVTRLKFCVRFGDGDGDVAVPVYLPPNLSHLTVKKIRLEEHSMAALEKLPNLLYLKLKDMIKPDGVTEITVSGFPKLKVLRLQNIEYAYKLEIKESAMPELNQLIVFNCPNLDFENVPERIKSAIIVETH